MNREIAISIEDKVARTEFDAVVSNNSGYRLKFTFDEEWQNFPARVAVVVWADGAAEQLFEGDECMMPPVLGKTDWALVGVYAKTETERIASTFVRLRCEAGASGCSPKVPVLTLHEQILGYLNEKDWSLFDEKVEEGVYSAVQVNAVGQVTKGMHIIEVGREGESEPSETLSAGGIFFCLTGGVYVPYYFDGEALLPLNLSASAEGARYDLNIGEKSYNGSAEVTVTADDLKLAKVAVSGSYNDLTDKPDGAAGGVTSVNGQTGEVTLTGESLGLGKLSALDTVTANELAVNSIPGTVLSNHTVNGAKLENKTVDERALADGAVTGAKLSDDAIEAGENISVTRKEEGGFTISATGGGSGGGVTSVNGQTGAVTITKHSLGLDNVTAERQMPLFSESRTGADFNTVTENGFYHITGDFDTPAENAPMSLDNLSGEDCSWFLLVMATGEDCVQLAFSARTDAAVRMRSKTGGEWIDWEAVYA